MTRKDQKKQVFNQQKLNSPYCNLPVHTRDTAGTGSGMPRYAKVDYRTRTRVTRFGKPAGFPVPVRNPMGGWNVCDVDVDCPSIHLHLHIPYTETKYIQTFSHLYVEIVEVI